MPTYYNSTNYFPIYNKKFIRTTTDILSQVHDIEVTDVSVIYFNKYIHMFHHECIKNDFGAQDSNTCPPYNSVGSHVDCQSYDGKIKCKTIFVLLTAITLKVMIMTIIILLLLLVVVMVVIMLVIIMMMVLLMIIIIR